LANLKLEDWQIEAIRLMVQSGKSLKASAAELQVIISVDEANQILRRTAFQKALQEEKHRYFNELGSNPNFRKETAIGRLLRNAEKLELNEKWADAAEVIYKICKMQGWTGPESTVNVFGELSQRDLDEIKEKLQKQSKVNQSVNISLPERHN
jgi:hypothetical protein